MTHSTQPQPDQGWSSSFDKDSTGVEVNRYMCVVSAKKNFYFKHYPNMSVCSLIWWWLMIGTTCLSTITKGLNQPSSAFLLKMCQYFHLHNIITITITRIIISNISITSSHCHLTKGQTISPSLSTQGPAQTWSWFGFWSFSWFPWFIVMTFIVWIILYCHHLQSSVSFSIIIIREGVQKKHFSSGDFSQMWMGWVADSQTWSKPLKKTQITLKIAFFDLNFTFRSPKSHKTLGWVGGFFN